MRLLKSLICACAATLTAASTAEDSFVLFGPHSRPTSGSKPPSLSPIAARLVLAKRLGLDQYHSLQDVDEGVIETLGNLASSSPDLFPSGQQPWSIEQYRRQQLTLIYLDGWMPSQDFLDEVSPVFTIADAPNTSSSQRLIEDFLAQARHAESKAFVSPFDSWHAPYIKGGLMGGIAYKYWQLPTYSYHPDIINFRKAMHELTAACDPALRDFEPYQGKSLAIIHISVEELVQTIPNEEISSAEAQVEAHQALSRLIQNIDEHTTIVIVPRRPSAKNPQTTFGTYDVPSDHIPHSRRQLADEEEPLVTLAKTASTSSTSALKRPTSTSPPLSLNTTTPIKTTLPRCHSSNRTCVAATNACSGHGTCALLYTDRKSESSKKAECWACACTASVVKLKGGDTRTTRWAGTACQKKDVSSSFFLLAGLSIALVGMATWGVGLMYSVGEEDLPSVIAAGVAGPRAQS